MHYKNVLLFIEDYIEDSNLKLKSEVEMLLQLLRVNKVK